MQAGREVRVAALITKRDGRLLLVFASGPLMAARAGRRKGAR